MANRVGSGCCLVFAQSRVGLLALLCLLLVGVGVALKSPTVEAQTPADFTVQIAARLNPDGRVEFGLRLLDREGNPGERLTGPERFFPRQLDHHRWLKASPIQISQPSAAHNGEDEVAQVRIVARIHPTRDQIEFGLQYELPEWETSEDNGGYSERIYPSKRFWPESVDHHRWLYASETVFTVHYREFIETMSEAGTLGQVPYVQVPIPSETVDSCVGQIAEDAEAMVSGQCEEVLAEYCESHQENTWCRQLIASKAEAERRAQQAPTEDGPTAEEIAKAEAERKLLELLRQCLADGYPFGVKVHEECDPIIFQYCEKKPGDGWCIQKGYLEPLPSALQANEDDFFSAVAYCENRVVNLGRDMGTVCDALFQESCERDRLQGFCSELGYVELVPADYLPSGTPVQQCVNWVQTLDLPLDPHCRDILQDSCDDNRHQQVCRDQGLKGPPVPADYLPSGTPVQQCVNWVQTLDLPIDPHCRDILQDSCDDNRHQQVCRDQGLRGPPVPADYYPDGTPGEQCVFWVQDVGMSIDPHCREILQDHCDRYRLEPVCAEHGFVELVPPDYMPYGTWIEQCWNWVLDEGEPIDPYCRATLQQDCDQMVAQWWFYEGCVDLGLSDHPPSEPIQSIRIGPPVAMEADDGSMLEAGDPVVPSDSDYDDCREDPTLMCPSMGE